MNKTIAASAVLALAIGAVTAAAAQTASPSDRDTTVQTGGPNGTSGAVGPNDRPSGADKDGTTASTPPARATTHAHHHHASKPPAAAPQAG